MEEEKAPQDLHNEISEPFESMDAENPPLKTIPSKENGDNKDTLEDLKQLYTKKESNKPASPSKSKSNSKERAAKSPSEGKKKKKRSRSRSKSKSRSRKYRDKDQGKHRHESKGSRKDSKPLIISKRGDDNKGKYTDKATISTRNIRKENSGD